MKRGMLTTVLVEESRDDQFTIRGKVNHARQLEFVVPPGLPPGEEVSITITVLDSDADAADEARWNELFSRPESLRMLEEWGVQVLKDDEAGLTEPLDPDQ